MSSKAETESKTPGKPRSKPFPIRFRDDLIVSNRQDGEGKPLFLIRDPVSKAAYNFGEEEYFLCQSMNGKATGEEIMEAFELKFGTPISREALDGLGDYLRSLSLVEATQMPEPTDPNGEGGTGEGGEPTDADYPDDEIIEDPKERSYRYKWYNPEFFFDWLVPIMRPLRYIAMAMNFLAFPLTPIVFYIYFSQIDEVNAGLRTFGNMISFVGSIFFMLFTVNLIRVLIQGSVITYYGLRVKETGIRLEFGMIPHCYISKNGVRHLSRHAKLWTYGTTLLVRLHFFLWGMVCWAILHRQGGLLPALAAVFAQSGLGGLIFQLVPHRQTEGQLWMGCYFGWPGKVVFRAMDICLTLLKGQPLPTSITKAQRNKYIYFMIGLLFVWCYVFVKMVSTITFGLEQSFPGIFGQATPFFMFLIVMYFMLEFIPHKFAPVVSKHGTGNSTGRPPTEEEIKEKSSGVKYMVLGLVLIFLLLPIPFRPGGEIEVQPPVQQSVPASVSGRITKVFFQGGDGQFLKKGTVVAMMESDEIDNAIASLKEQVSAKEAIAGKQKAALDELLAGARQEDLDAARAKVDHAKEGVKIANKDLDSAKLSATFSNLVVTRLEKLYNQGGYAYLDIEEARKKAQIAAVDVEKAERNEAAALSVQAQAQAELDLLLAGAKPQDIDAARKALEASQADVRRAQQQLKYQEDKLAGSPVIMPIDGFLVDSYLMGKVGSYLKEGDKFSGVQTTDKPTVVIKLPEYETGNIDIDAKSEVKLWVKPNSPYIGKVLSMEPSSTETLPGETTVIYRVNIELNASTKEVRPGMTGYGKIYAGTAPIGVIITRPIVRFLTVEVWSWLP